MTTVDSQTVASLDTTDPAFGATKKEFLSTPQNPPIKNNDDAQVGIINVTSEELDLLGVSDLGLVFFPKGKGSGPIGGGIRADQASRSKSSSSSTPKKNPPTTGTHHPRGVPTTSGTLSRGNDKSKKVKKP